MGKKTEKAKEWIANDVKSRSKFGVKQQWRSLRSKVASYLLDFLPNGIARDMIESLVDDVEYAVDKKVNKKIDSMN